MKKVLSVEAQTHVDEALMTELVIPKCPTHAKSLSGSSKWIEAMNSKIQMMKSLDTYTCRSQKVIGTKWVFTKKKTQKRRLTFIKLDWLYLEITSVKV